MWPVSLNLENFFGQLAIAHLGTHFEHFEDKNKNCLFWTAILHSTERKGFNDDNQCVHYWLKGKIFDVSQEQCTALCFILLHLGAICSILGLIIILGMHHKTVMTLPQHIYDTTESPIDPIWGDFWLICTLSSWCCDYFAPSPQMISHKCYKFTLNCNFSHSEYSQNGDMKYTQVPDGARNLD